LEPGATILLPWVQLLIYVFTAGVAMLLAWPAIRDSWVRFRRRTEANLKMSAYLVIIILAVNMLLSLLIGLLTQT
ncbi:CPBP family intramembrane metalloprotease, partial [Erysipelatoclostridium ramosum]|nr:CPBP family intramembrane metalloprotease [Thomasclavelia ramosa]